MLGLILLSLFLLIGFASTFIPVTRIEKKIDFTIINPELPDVDLPNGLPIYISEEMRTLKLAYPQWFWRGDTQFISLSIQPDATSQKPTQINQSRYHVYLEARLEVAFMQMVTGDTVIEAVDANQSAQFLWQIRAETSGRTKGNLWIFVNIADSQSDKTWRLTRFALPLQLEIKDIIGLPLSSVRSFTLIGFFIVLSAGLVFIFFHPRKV